MLKHKIYGVHVSLKKSKCHNTQPSIFSNTVIVYSKSEEQTRSKTSKNDSKNFRRKKDFKRFKKMVELENYVN